MNPDDHSEPHSGILRQKIMMVMMDDIKGITHSLNDTIPLEKNQKTLLEHSYV